MGTERLLHFGLSVIIYDLQNGLLKGAVFLSTVVSS